MAAAYRSKQTLNSQWTVWAQDKNNIRYTIGLVQLVRQSQPLQYVAPVTADSVVCLDNIEGLIIEPAGTIAALTVTMPALPFDGQVVFLTATQTVTTLTHQAAAGQTLNGALTTITATRTTHGSWVYRAANTTWYVVM